MMSNLNEYRKTVSNYNGLLANLDNLITESNFKINFFLEKLGMKRATFYNKRKNGNFAPGEVDQILQLLAENE